jgi:uncharacterized HhH-GPD family protein
VGKYDAWVPVFAELEEDPSTIAVDDLADLVPGGLPDSAYKYQAWWASPQNHAVWKNYGWRASPDFSRGQVIFRRTRELLRTHEDSAVVEIAPDEPRLLLIGCVETKLGHPAPAQDLYVSPLWQKRRRYAEESEMSWRILSAEYGLVDPEQVIEPYDRYLGSQPSGYRTEWSQQTAEQVLNELQKLGLSVVEVHAGSDYLENGLISRLEDAGVKVVWPLRGHRFGEHLAWYDARRFSKTDPVVAEYPQSADDSPSSQEAADLAAALRDLADRVERFFAATTPPISDETHDDREALIVEQLLAYGKQIVGVVDSTTAPEFTPDPDANEFWARDPFAFLLAVIADYQISAERAWAVPWELKKRLGHLDPHLMLEDPEALYAAFDQPPKLHRFIRNVPHFFLSASRLVVEEYKGDAGRIWGDEPTAHELQARLVRFPGISQKKAAMAVEILERDLGVPIREMEGSDLAFDVHVRRVMLRTGLASVDDQQHMIERARQLNPERPGALDFPMWNIGRTWCHAGVPECDLCVLGEVCPKLVDAARGVRGA